LLLLPLVRCRDKSSDREPAKRFDCLESEAALAA